MSTNKRVFNSPETVGAAETLVDLLNTRSHAGLGDTLVDGTAVAEVLAPFAPGSSAAEASDLDVIRRLRDALSLTLSEDRSAQEAAWAEVNQLMGAATVHRVFTPSGVVLDTSDGDPVLGGVASAIQVVMDADSWSRLRLCSNHLCDSAFFDTTRSRTQKWHSYESCGNRANVSAHRKRVQERQAK